MAIQFLDYDGVWKSVADDDPIYGVNFEGEYTGHDDWDWHGKSLAGQQYRTTSDGGGGGHHAGGLEIPEGAYPKSESSSTSSSRSGLPQWGLDLIEGLAPRMPGMLDAHGKAIDDMANLPGMLGDWQRKSGDAYLAGLGDFNNYLRKPLNNLAGRGVLDSTMTRDAITNIGGLLADDFKEQQTSLGAESLKTSALNLGQIASQRGSAVDAMNRLLSLANTSTSQSESSSSQSNPLAQYELLLSLLMQ